MTLSAFARTSYRAAWLGVVVLCLALLALGCSRIRTVTVPAQESSVRQLAPDTIEVQELPPARLKGEITLAEEVIVYDDTSRPTFDVSLIEVDRTDPENQQVRVRVEAGSTTVERRLAMPPIGEGLRVQKSAVADDSMATNRPRDTPSLRQTVFGTPTDYQVEADVSEITLPWWRRALQRIETMVAFGAGLFVGYAIVKLVPGV